MNKNILKGNWKELRGKIKEQWGDLTDDEIDQSQGNMDQLAGKIQARYGVGVDKVKEKLNSFLGRANSKMDKSDSSRFDGDNVNIDSEAS